MLTDDEILEAEQSLKHFLSGFGRHGQHALNDLHRIPAEEWQQAAEEELKRRQLRLVASFDDRILAALKAGKLDIHQVIRETQNAPAE